MIGARMPDTSLFHVAHEISMKYSYIEFVTHGGPRGLDRGDWRQDARHMYNPNGIFDSRSASPFAPDSVAAGARRRWGFSPEAASATNCNTLPRSAAAHTNSPEATTATHCNTLQHTATHCNTLQHCHDRPRPIRIVFLWGTKSACCQVFRLRWETHKNSPKIAYSQKIADLSTHEEVPPRGPSTSSWGSGGRAAVFGVFSLRR